MNRNYRNVRMGRFRPKRRFRKRNRPGLKESYFSTDLRITTYSYNLEAATSFPLLLRLGAFFNENIRLQQICTLFQQYSLVKIKITVIPEIYQGTTPFILYMLCSTDREIATNTETVLSKGVRCSNTRAFTKTIRSRGRQNDFNYWFDTRFINEADKRPTLQIAFAPDSYGREPKGSYVITIVASFRFRYPQSVVPPTANIMVGKGEEDKKQEQNKIEEVDWKALSEDEEDIEEVKEEKKEVKKKKNKKGQ